MSNRGTVKIVLHKEWTIDLAAEQPAFDMDVIFDNLAESGDIGGDATKEDIRDAFKQALEDDRQSELEEISLEDFQIIVSDDALIEGKE